MSQTQQEIQEQVKSYIMENFLAGEDADSLTESTPLISGGVMDSISTVKLVTYLEEAFGVQFQAHEISTDYLDTLNDIAAIVQQKSAA